MDDNIIIRPADLGDRDAITDVHVRTWQTCYSGILPAEYLSNIPVERRRVYWNDVLSNPDSTEFVFVALLQDCQKIIGFASAGPSRDDTPPTEAELYTIYILSEYQGRGIGSRLFAASCGELIDREFTSLRLWVLLDNSYKDFYKARGGELIGTRECEIGGSSYSEECYGWRQIPAL